VDQALAAIGAEPAGGVFVLLRDPDPAALSKRFAPQGEEEPQHQRMLREYGVGAQILRDLGVRRMTLLSNARQKVIGLMGYGLEIAGWRDFTE